MTTASSQRPLIAHGDDVALFTRDGQEFMGKAIVFEGDEPARVWLARDFEPTTDTPLETWSFDMAKTPVSYVNHTRKVAVQTEGPAIQAPSGYTMIESA